MSQFAPPNPPPMAPQYPPPPAPRSSGVSCLLGCLIVAVILFILAVVGVVAAWFYGTAFLVENFTDATPVELPEAQISEAEQADLQVRVDAFEQALAGQGEQNELVLTGPEINALLQQYASDSPFANSIYVTIEGDSLAGQISLPIEQVVDIEAVRGRYLNGSATFDFSVVNGRPVLFVTSLEVKGQAVPEMAMQDMGNQNLLQDMPISPEQKAVLDKIRDIRVRDGKLIVELKEGLPAEAPVEEEVPVEEVPAEAPM
jgi:hypothetical protein